VGVNTAPGMARNALWGDGGAGGVSRSTPALAKAQAITTGTVEHSAGQLAPMRIGDVGGNSRTPRAPIVSNHLAWGQTPAASTFAANTAIRVGFGIEASVLRAQANKANAKKADSKPNVTINTTGQAVQKVAEKRQPPMPGGVTK